MTRDARVPIKRRTLDGRLPVAAAYTAASPSVVVARKREFYGRRVRRTATNGTLQTGAHTPCAPIRQIAVYLLITAVYPPTPADCKGLGRVCHTIPIDAIFSLAFFWFFPRSRKVVVYFLLLLRLHRIFYVLYSFASAHTHTILFCSP